ncbi:MULTISPECIES: phage portal protein [unclassified Agrococcus]|uniref:phage portal protein n=1 Tax=unclassified Agrococcus TaxID=2615065 RepID=UPI003613C3E7
MIAVASTAVDGLPRFMTNVSDAELDIVRGLMKTWIEKRPGNVRNSMYYDGKMPLRPTGNIPPEAMARIRASLGWPERAVGGLGDRMIFDGFAAPDQGEDPFELEEILDGNRFDLELPQAITSSLKHSCSFITTARGDVASGEPEILVMARSAEWSAAKWDKRRRRVSSYMAITDVDEHGRASAVDVYLPDVVLLCRRRSSGAWTAERKANALGEVWAEPLAFDPQLDRPFGRSRITRGVRTITDHAIANIIRTEIGADFYAAPRMLALGVGESAFAKSKWALAIDRWLAISRDENGDLPTVTQMAQMTTQPLADLHRIYASQIAGETGLPISSLGIVQDNPPSAEALYAAEKDLIVKSRAQVRVYGAALRQVARRIVRLRDGKDAYAEELRGLQASWLDPAFTSPVTASAALEQLSRVFPWFAESPEALKFAGFSGPTVTRLLADKRRAEGSGTMAALIEAARRPATGETASPSEAVGGV